jgi:amidase
VHEAGKAETTLGSAGRWPAATFYAVDVTITRLTELLRTRKLSPVELIEYTIRQIDHHNPTLNAFVVTYSDRSREEAKQAEQRYQRGEARPLEGLPVTIKDSLDVAGSPTTCGSLLFKDNRPTMDATCVRLLREAGAIVVGKTSCPEFLMNYETDNRIIGRTNNPWNLDRTPGGSSGGEAAAIASFCSAGGIGSDGGGSVRWPAHACGIAALKPTPGRVSAAGHLPVISHPGGLLGVAGPMARTAQDLKLLFQTLAHFDPADPFSTPMPQCWPSLTAFRKQGLKIGLMPGWYDVPVQAAIGDAVTKAGKTFEQLGYAVEPFRPKGLERAPNLWWFFFGQLFAPLTMANIAGHEDQLHWTGLELLDIARKQEEPTIPKLLENMALRDKLRSSLLAEMETHRVLLLPAAGVTAWPHRTRRWPTPKKEIGLFEAMMPLTPFNLFGMPGLVIPFGIDSDGLPCGIQLVGRPYDEELLLDLAIELETMRGPIPAPPGYAPLV